MEREEEKRNQLEAKVTSKESSKECQKGTPFFVGLLVTFKKRLCLFFQCCYRKSGSTLSFIAVLLEVQSRFQKRPQCGRYNFRRSWVVIYFRNVALNVFSFWVTGAEGLPLEKTLFFVEKSTWALLKEPQCMPLFLCVHLSGDEIGKLVGKNIFGLKWTQIKTSQKLKNTQRATKSRRLRRSPPTPACCRCFPFGVCKSSKGYFQSSLWCFYFFCL